MENLIAFALLFFNIERLESVIPTLEASSDAPTFLFAIITSRLTIIGKVFPPYLYREVIFFFILDSRLEKIGKDSGEQRQQQENDGYDQREKGSEKGGKKLDHNGNDDAAYADDPEIGDIFHDKRISFADVHGQQPSHCQRDKGGNADGIQHGDHDLLGIGRNFHRGILYIQINEPWESDIDNGYHKHNDADEETRHVTEIEFQKLFDFVQIHSFLSFARKSTKIIENRRILSATRK